MIFMSQSGLLDRTAEHQWDVWYEDHLRLMLTVPQFKSAQRFKTETPEHPPSLAMYTITSGDVFQDPYYQSVRGMGEWAAGIDQRYYKRNLFDGLDVAPACQPDEVLLIADRNEPDPSCPGFTWLRAVAVDRSPPCRGIRIVSGNEAEALVSRLGDIALYRPFSIDS